jgi:hypothetical protein
LRKVLTNDLLNEERDTDRNRSIQGVLAGFAFAGIATISALKSIQIQEFELEISLYYLVISFLCYLMALNLESYKSFVFQLPLSDLLMDIADLAFVCSVFSFIYKTNYFAITKVLIISIAGAVWLIHYIYLIVCRFEAMTAVKYRVLNTLTRPNEEKQQMEKIFEFTNFAFVLTNPSSRLGFIQLEGFNYTRDFVSERPLVLQPYSTPPLDKTLSFSCVESESYEGDILSPSPVKISFSAFTLPNWVEKIKVIGENKEIIQLVNSASLPLAMPAPVYPRCVKHGFFLGGTCPYPPPHI